MDNVMPLNSRVLTHHQKREAMDLITLIKMKRCGKIKVLVCVNGRKQRRYIAKDDVTSHMVQLEGLMATIVVDAMEGRKVATADVAGTYLQTVMTDYVMVKVSGESYKIMREVNPNFSNYVTVENKRKTLYIGLKKAQYGCMQSALLWYKTFKDHLEG